MPVAVGIIIRNLRNRHIILISEEILCGANFLGKSGKRLFRSLSPHFVVFINGERDLSTIPNLGGAAVQISLKIGERTLLV